VDLEALKVTVRTVGSRYADREARARRLFIEERAVALRNDRDREFSIRSEISRYFDSPHSSVAFCGSAQLGFSVPKNDLFRPGLSDLDAAIVSPNVYQRAWKDIVDTTRAFTDDTAFGSSRHREIELFKDQILRRGMIRIQAMPISPLSSAWKTFEGQLSRAHTTVFKSISIAIYMNEYAFCWKQDSAIAALMRR
jgi:hypothetical protein